jgi:transposase
VRARLRRYNNEGLDGLTILPRSGRPATYSAEQVAEFIATASSDPQRLGQPFACRTLDRLESYIDEEKKIEIRRSRIDELLIAEGLRWRTEETWFGDRVDPESAKKRGLLKRSTPARLKRAR